eukprot:10453645-Ditylum_brightwellii.AAC.1
MVPFGFAGELIWHLTLSGHASCQTPGVKLLVPAVHTHPAPRCCTSTLQSCRASQMNGVRQMKSGSPTIAIWSGEKRPAPPSILKEAC